MTAIKEKNGKELLAEYVVTVTQEHFVVVRARSTQQARKRGLAELRNRWGVGRSPQVTEIERIDS